MGLQICNSIGCGEIKVTEDEMYFHSNPESTMIACDALVSELEDDLVQFFSEKLSYSIEDGVLSITNGEIEAVFTLESNSS